jgi:t-SNARE complex subunit (syntaxin)
MNKQSSLSNLSMEELIQLVLDLQSKLRAAEEKIDMLQANNERLQADNEKMKAELARAKKSRPSQR